MILLCTALTFFFAKKKKVSKKEKSSGLNFEIESEHQAPEYSTVWSGTPDSKITGRFEKNKPSVSHNKHRLPAINESGQTQYNFVLHQVVGVKPPSY